MLDAQTISVMSKLREKRIEKGLTLMQVAGLVRTNVGNLSRIERGQQFPSPPLAVRLSRVYGMALEDVFSVSDHQEA